MSRTAVRMRSPSKSLSRDFLRELRANRYVSIDAKGRTKEYAPDEVDQAYFEKATRLAVEEAERLEREHWSNLPVGEFAPPTPVIIVLERPRRRFKLPGRAVAFAVSIALHAAGLAYFLAAL